MMLFPFLNRTLFLWLLGPEYLGLNGLFGSVLGVLSLAELGFGSAVVCSMYKPIADDDKELIAAYLAYYRKVYRVIGGLVFVVGLSLLPFLSRLVHGDVPPDVNLHMLYFIHLVNTTLGYFLFAYKGALLSAYQREDIHSHIRTGVSMGQYLATFAILVLSRNYTYYVLTTVVFTVVTNVCIEWQTRRLFPEIFPRGVLASDKRQKVVADVKAIFLHKIGSVISYSADNLVISASLGLVAIAVYGNYYYVYTAVGGIVYVVFNSLTAGFGNTIRTESVADNFARFMKANRLSMLVIAWCTAMMLALYQPFMRVWVGEQKPELVQHFLTPVLMVVYFYVNESRQMLQTFKSAAGLWQEDRWKPIVSGVVNLALNISMIRWLGLDGVILSTVFAFLFIEIPWESAVLFRCYFEKRAEDLGLYRRRYWKFQVYAVVGTAMLALLTWGMAWIIPMGGIPGLVVKGLVAALFALSLLTGTFLLRRRSFLPQGGSL
ncbi:MAG: polysaccharide biosynthesis protein [Kiritimatiellae bacterium]|nr:polysaccharide biosynthesis protein [Kiritimatiellia bacterium]